MNDDFAGDATTTATYSVFDLALPAKHEVSGDVDWIRVNGLQQHFQYDVWLFRSTDDDFTSRANLSIYDSNSNLIWSQLSRSVPGRTSYRHSNSNGDHFVSVASTGSSTSVGGYRLYIRTADLAGNSIEDADSFAPTQFNQFASALENNADDDFLKYYLFEGVEYTFNLLGKQSNSQNGTTLNRMALRLRDAAGNLLAEDDATAFSRNASITFTPASSAVYLFEINSDESTGSYILESSQFDDYRGNVDTQGVLDANGVAVSGLANFGTRSGSFRQDEDWFQFEPQEAGFTYEIESEQAWVSLRNRNGEAIGAEQVSQSPRIIRFTPEVAGRFFVVANQMEEGTRYELSARIVDDHGSTNSSASNFPNFASVGTIDGAIEEPGDRDWIQIFPDRLANYRFTVDADPALQMAVSIRNSEGLVKNGTPSKPLVFSSEFDDIYYLDVRSNANATGRWTLRSEAVRGGSDDSTTWNVNLSTGRGRIRSLTNDAADAPEQWHRFEVTPNTWYEIESQIVDFEVRNADGSQTIDYTKGKRYYYSGNTGDAVRYLVVDPKEQNFDEERGFEIKFVKDALLKPSGTGQFSPGNARFGNEIFGFQFVEVYSSKPFRFLESDQPVFVAANTYRTLSPEEWFSITFDETFTDVGNFYFRGMRFQGNSQWSAMELYGHNLPAGMPRSDIVFPFATDIKFAFAESKPDYLADDSVVGATSPLTESEREALRNAFFQWDQNVDHVTISMTEPGENNDSAAIMIYKAELESDTLAFSLAGDPDGAGLAGDIILNVNSPLWTDLSKGSKGQFELLRAVGVSLGATKLATVGRDQSVMGIELTGNDANLPYASSLLPADISALRSPTRIFPHPSTNQKEYRLDEDSPMYETIIHSGAHDGSFLSSETSALNATIDLRPGQSSFISDGSSRPSTWLMSNFSVINEARAGSGDDSIRGNAERNSLFGNRGNDTLIGGVGNDFLSGGQGDDYYSYHLGHDSDVINENDGSGTDTLRIEGLKNFDGMEDLQFRRFGDNLKITLELDNRDRNADSIVIRNMGSRDSAVERLVLIREGNFINSVSLQSVWAQTDNQLRRFELGQGSDDFGRLANPA